MQRVVEDEHGSPDHWWFRARRDIFGRMIRQRVGLREGARVLDVGPGSGVNLPMFAELGARHGLTVLDRSIGSLESCRAGGAQRDGGMGLVQADGARHPFRAGSFDLVCALDVIEHLDDDRGALAEFRRVLKPDGALLVSVPAFQVLWGRMDVLAEHKRRYRRADLEARLREAGFRLERATYFNCLLFPPILLVRLLMRPFLRWTRTGGSDLGMPTPGLNGLFYRLFAAEGSWVVDRNLPFGVSIVALARPA